MPPDTTVLKSLRVTPDLWCRFRATASALGLSGAGLLAALLDTADYDVLKTTVSEGTDV